jgi:N utilization substance protein A
VRLASQLTGWDIRILTEAQESERRQEEFRSRSQMFIDALDVDEVIAHLLVTEGFSSIEEVAFVPIDEITGIEGFDRDLAEELAGRAKAYLSEQAEKFAEKRKELGIADDMVDITGLTPDMVVTLAEKGIKKRDDLAELAGWELSGSEAEGEAGLLADYKISESDANAIIAQARAHWYEAEDKAAAEAAAAAAAAEAEAAGTETGAEAGTAKTEG